ncbi:Dam family site-specific DNA-(adenine-N6)-methyltransferase [Bradyrhizobium sp. NP1]|uniref:DNA adenine methylase n=1 Tax=Bradyrhizobium sp. NP1 TaxID=3049772 RepID=UPI0025A4F5E6|nr:Dam family site-specific DNA-(adenine-N6)-methyltransferase [Bradyrhizobium sp. NP1]WJR79647.1 Dam family site-specific DNA-(adenine-N6)-methyltransferase [Bradyrhizobium sp. NP1]
MPEIILPFLKWAGGKRWLTNNTEFEVPRFSGRYIEPFLGSGSIFFWLQPNDAMLSDLNSELIATYVALRDEHAKVLRHLRQHARSHSKAHYYKARDEFRPRSTAARAARFLYLNRTCWNGLYRVNLEGKFNVPKGTKSNVILGTDDFKAVSKILQKAKLVCCDFETVIDEAKSGDLIYADPPYTVRHNMNGFIKYNEVLFSWEDQQRLRAALLRASARGAKFLLSNADHASVRELYADVGSIKVVNRASIISGDRAARGTTTELLVSN